MQRDERALGMLHGLDEINDSLLKLWIAGDLLDASERARSK